jgi:Arc/MetJ family transcription regulator
LAGAPRWRKLGELYGDAGATLPYERREAAIQPGVWVPYHKTTVEIDLDALAQAGAILGTTGVKETVNGALREIPRRAALAEAARFVLGDEQAGRVTESEPAP